MIQEIFYTDNRTYIKGERGKEIDTDRIPFTEAFKLATIVNVEIDFENLTKTDIIDFSKYVEETRNTRNIYKTFYDLQQTGLKPFKEKAYTLTQKAIAEIIEDYNDWEYIRDGAEEYIIQTLKQNTNKKIIKLLDENKYDLDVFIYECRKINKEKEKKERLIILKKNFNDEFGCSTQALDDYVEYLSTFGGDYTSYIADAFNKCFDALIDNEPFCDRDGLIEYLGDLEV